MMMIHLNLFRYILGILAATITKVALKVEIVFGITSGKENNCMEK